MVKVERPTGTGITFSVVANEYLDEAERRFAKKTYDDKARCYRRFISSMGDKPIDRVSSLDVDRFLKTCRSNNAFNVAKKDLGALFAYALKRKYVRENPVSEIDPMPHTPARKLVPTNEQVGRMLMAARVDEKPFILTILYTFARSDEINRLTWDDVNFERKTVTLWTRKRKGGSYESDTMAMPDALRDILQGLHKKRTSSPYVFNNPETGTRYRRRGKMMKSICKRAFDPECKKLADYEGPVFGFHSLRHFALSAVSDAGKHTLKTMQGLARHKRMATTERYLHSLDDGKRAAADELEDILVAGVGGGLHATKGENLPPGGK